MVEAIKRTERLAHWCGRYTPWTALDDTGGVWMDITGCAHLFGGERAMIGDLVARVADQELAVRAAVADTPGAAWAVARFGKHPSHMLRTPSPCPSPPVGGEGTMYRRESPLPHAGEGQGEGEHKAREGSFEIVEPGAHRELLAPLPVAALRIGDAAEGLRRLGIRRIGDLYPIPRAPLSARFGDDVLKRLDQALGRTDEPLSPIRPAPSRRVRITFPDPIGLKDDLWAAFERLLAALLQRLEDASAGVIKLELVGYRADGTLAYLGIGIGSASRDADHIRRLVAEKFDAFDPGYGIEAMVLAAVRTEALKPAQRGLAGNDRARESFARLLDRLENRLGDGGLGGLACAESHMPERALVPTPPAGGEGQGEGQSKHAPTLPRPLHLLSPPEPVEAMAPVPDGPPVLFKWRRRTHRVTRADGPERIAPEWWLEDPARLASGQARIRDYYHVEDDSGARYWLFRAGLYQTDKPPRWYMHGLFS